MVLMKAALFLFQRSTQSPTNTTHTMARLMCQINTPVKLNGVIKSRNSTTMKLTGTKMVSASIQMNLNGVKSQSGTLMMWNGTKLSTTSIQTKQNGMKFQSTTIIKWSGKEKVNTRIQKKKVNTRIQMKASGVEKLGNSARMKLKGMKQFHSSIQIMKQDGAKRCQISATASLNGGMVPLNIKSSAVESKSNPSPNGVELADSERMPHSKVVKWHGITIQPTGWDV